MVPRVTRLNKVTADGFGIVVKNRYVRIDRDNLHKVPQQRCGKCCDVVQDRARRTTHSSGVAR